MKEVTDGMAEAEKLTSSQKLYLLTIYQLYLHHGSVKVTELARAAGVSKSSATCMATKLCERGYLHKVYYGSICLTKNGLLASKAIYEPVKAIYDFLTQKLSVEEVQAQKDAVAMVVHVSEDTVHSLMDFLKIK